MDADLRRVLETDNPWLRQKDNTHNYSEQLPNPYVPRLQLDQIVTRWQSSNRAHLLVGPRRAGKSTVIWHYLSKQSRPVFYLDCEQHPVQQWCRSAPVFLEDLRSITDQSFILFLDEVQHLEEAGLFVKGLVDRKFGNPILVTGSSAFHLGAKTRESLAGRATRGTLYPFSLDEVLWDVGEYPKLGQRTEREVRFEKAIIYGGYPEVWLSAQPEQILQDLKEAFVLRDASDLHNIGRPDAFRRLLQLGARQVGNLLNYSEWAQILGINKDTVSTYLEILEGAHVLVQLPPFVGGKRSELTRNPKLYFIDNGLRNILLSDFRSLNERTDSGACLENWIFSELIKSKPKGFHLSFWRSTAGAEVDFILSSGSQSIGIEVKAQTMQTPRLTKSIHSFRKAYQPKIQIMINLSLEHQEQDEIGHLIWTKPDQLSSILRQIWS